VGIKLKGAALPYLFVVVAADRIDEPRTEARGS